MLCLKTSDLVQGDAMSWPPPGVISAPAPNRRLHPRLSESVAACQKHRGNPKISRQLASASDHYINLWRHFSFLQASQVVLVYSQL